MPVRLILLFGWLFLATAMLRAEDARLPAPPASQYEVARKLAREIYAKEYDAAKTTDLKTALATKLIGLAEKAQDPTERYVLLEISRDIAVNAGDAKLAWDVFNRLEKYYQVDLGSVRQDAVAELAKSVATVEQQQALVSWIKPMIVAAVERDDYSNAERLAETAAGIARRSKVSALIAETSVQSKQVQQVSRAFEKVKSASAILQTEPTNADANLTVGKFRAFYRGDWDAGIANLALGNDSEIRIPAEIELRLPTSLEDIQKVGDAWWDLAQSAQGYEKEAMLLRAGMWYEMLIAELPLGLQRTKYQKRLVDAFALKRPLPRPPVADVQPGQSIPLRSWVDALAWYEIVGQGKQLGATRDGSGVILPSHSGMKGIWIPVDPRGDYDAILVLGELNEKGGTRFSISVGEGHTCMPSLSHSLHLVELNNGSYSKRGNLGNVSMPGPGQPFRIYLSVRDLGANANIRITMDGTPTLNWEGSKSRLHSWRSRKELNRLGLEIGSWEIPVVCYQALVRPLSGTATRVIQE